MLDPRPQEMTSAPHDAMHRVPFFQKQFGQIGAVLSSDAGDQRAFVRTIHLPVEFYRPASWFSFLFFPASLLPYQPLKSNMSPRRTAVTKASGSSDRSP